jgi:hypothetical protein
MPLRTCIFTQSLEPLEGGGLGRAALDQHLQLLRAWQQQIESLFRVQPGHKNDPFSLPNAF